MKNNFSKKLPWLILAGLIVLALPLYYYVSHNYFLSTIEIAFFDNADDIDKVFKDAGFHDKDTGSSSITVVYFWQAYCPCDATVLPHYKLMTEEYGEKSVDFFLADFSAADQKYETPFDRVLDPAITEKLRPLITHTPSVAIWDQNGSLTYYGPHNLGFVCNSDTSFVKKVIDSILQSITSKNTNVVGNGCFCKI